MGVKILTIDAKRSVFSVLENSCKASRFNGLEEKESPART